MKASSRIKKARYSNEFKVTAVKLASHPDVQTKDVATSLDIHPFMLSRWKKDFREGRLPDCVKEESLMASAEEHKQIRQLKEQLQRLRIENDLLKKLYASIWPKKEVFKLIYHLVTTGDYKAAWLCQHYGVSRSGYYAWRHRPESRRSKENRKLQAPILTAHQRSHGTYGSPRVTTVLNRQGFICGENRVARVMRALRIVGKARYIYRRYQGNNRFFLRTGNLRLGHPPLTAPNQVWVGDITYVKLHKHYYYLAMILDVYSRKVISWSLSRQRTVDLTLRVLRKAIKERQPQPGLIFHSDRGIEYAAYDYEAELGRHGIRPSMNRPGQCVDNAHVESFFHTLKSEWLKDNPYQSFEELKDTIRYYIQCFYNRSRLHSGIGFYSPKSV